MKKVTLSVVAVAGLVFGTGCDLQTAATNFIADTVSQGLSQGVSQSGAFSNVDFQGVLNSFSSQMNGASAQ